MFKLLENLPHQVGIYYVALLFTVLLIIESSVRLKQLRWGFAALVFCTIGLWYLIDPVYRPDVYSPQFSVSEQNSAYVQVVVFLLAFRVFMETLVPRTPSRVLRSFDPRVMASVRIAKLLIVMWLALFTIGIARMDFNVFGALFPIEGRWVKLWARPRFGGSTEFLVSIGQYCYQLTCAGFGIVAVATANARVRATMVTIMLLTWPMFILGGTRSHFLSVAMPAILAILIMKPWSRGKQLAFLSVVVLVLNAAFLVVIEYRNVGLGKFFEERFVESGSIATEDKKHLGLNMAQELMYLMRYQEEGRLDVEWGGNYRDHALNFIPRAIWEGKPFPGGAYSALRVGYHKGEVAATISNGLVGQGVANFGVWLGPIAAAFILSLMANWVCRLPFRGNRFLRICLILIVFGKIPNLGRDITLFDLWPVIFGYVGILFYESNSRNMTRRLPVEQLRRRHQGVR